MRDEELLDRLRNHRGTAHENETAAADAIERLLAGGGVGAVRCDLGGRAVSASSDRCEDKIGVSECYSSYADARGRLLELREQGNESGMILQNAKGGWLVLWQCRRVEVAR